MNMRITLALMVAFVVLGTFAFFDPLRLQEKEEAKQERESHVLWLKDAKIETLDLKGSMGLNKFLCKQKGGCGFDSNSDWELTQPVSDKADPASMGALTSALFNLSPNDKVDFEAAPDPKEFGLDAPQMEIEVRIKGRTEPLLLKFGKNSAVSPNVYVSVSEEPKRLYLVPSYVPNQWNRDLFYWRSKRIFPLVEVTALEKIGWKSKKFSASFARQDKQWRVESPVKGNANHIMIEGLASTVAYANAKSMFAASRADPMAKKAISGAPELDIKFSQTDGSNHRLQLFPKAQVGKGAKEFIALADQNPTVFVLEAAGFDRFQKELLDYRQRSILSDELREKIDEVAISFPREKKELTLKLAKQQWAVASGEKPPGGLSQARVNSFLDSLRDADFLAIQPAKGASAEAKAFAKETPDLKIEIKGEGHSLMSLSFLVYQRSFALTEGDGELRVLGDKLLKYMPVRIAELNTDANQVVVSSEKGNDGNSSPAQPANH